MNPRRVPLALLLALGAACKGGPGAPDGGDGGTRPDGGSAVVGSVCDPTVQPDLCLSSGLACTPDYNGGSPTGALCQLPGPFFNCFPATGCAGKLSCIEADDAGDPGACVATCTTTADCADPLTTCAQLGGVGPTYCLANSCSNFW